MNLAERARATTATKNAFWGTERNWSDTTCVHVLHAHLVNTGHLPPDVPEFRTKKGAREALKAMGATSLPSLCRNLGLEEIAPAKMIVGDIAILPGAEGKADGIRSAITICAGNKFMGWYGDDGPFQNMEIDIAAVKAAFRP